MDADALLKTVIFRGCDIYKGLRPTGEAIMGWLAAAFIALPLVHVFAELGSRYAEPEGIGKYVEVGFGVAAYASIAVIAFGLGARNARILSRDWKLCR